MGSIKNRQSEITLYDIAQWIRGFEEQNAVTIDLRLRLYYAGRSPQLTCTAAANTPQAARAEVAPLALVSVNGSAEQLVTVQALILRTLYLLDARLAWREMRPEDKKGEPPPAHL